MWRKQAIVRSRKTDWNVSSPDKYKLHRFYGASIFLAAVSEFQIWMCIIDIVVRHSFFFRKINYHFQPNDRSVRSCSSTESGQAIKEMEGEKEAITIGDKLTKEHVPNLELPIASVVES